MIHLLLFGRQVYLKYSADEMSVYAAQASFFIIMAAFPFFMVLLALIQVAPMIHEADLLRFLLPAIPLSRTLDLPSGQSVLRLPGSPDLRDCAGRHLVRIKGDARDRKGLKPGIGSHVPAELYSPQGTLQRLHALFFPDVRGKSRAPRLRKLPSGNALKMDPCPGVPLGNDLPVPRSCHVFHADDLFYCALHCASAPQAFNPRTDPRCNVLRRRLGTHFPGILCLLPVFRLIRCHLRKSDRRDPFYAVALCLHLHSVCGGGDQLVSAVLQGKDPNFTEENCLGSYYKDLSFRPAGLRSNS